MPPTYAIGDEVWVIVGGKATKVTVRSINVYFDGILFSLPADQVYPSKEALIASL